VRPRSIVIEGHLGAAQALGELVTGLEGVVVQRHDGAGLLRVDGFALALSDGRTATERSLALGEPVAVFDLALDYAACTRIALAMPLQSSDAQRAQAVGLFTLLGKLVAIVADVPGLPVTRTVAMLVNEAVEAVNQGLASADDVDAAMCKGVNYPLGPLAWGRRIGLAHVAAVLGHLGQAYGEDRYRVSPWLRRAVHAEQALGGHHG
jgi:3-hydroxybutyryl-CoA dehydrogenase